MMKTAHEIIMVFWLVMIALVARAENIAPLTGHYLDMKSDSETGDILGLDLTISDTKAGYYAVFQAAEGSLCPPSVSLVSISEGNIISIKVPEGSCYGGAVLSGVIDKKGFTGSFVNGALAPTGEKSFFLPRTKCR